MTVRWPLLFILAVCPTPSPSRQLPVQEPLGWSPPRIFDVPPDATPAPALPPLPAPTACGVLGDECSGSCASTARGDLCFPGCETDDECRPKAGVFCDPQWHACMIPNTAA